MRIDDKGGFKNRLMDILFEFLKTTGFSSMTLGNAVMILIGIIFISLAIVKDYEPLLLVPIGMGAIVGNIPVIEGMSLSVYERPRWILKDGNVEYHPGQRAELSSTLASAKVSIRR